MVKYKLKTSNLTKYFPAFLFCIDFSTALVSVKSVALNVATMLVFLSKTLLYSWFTKHFGCLFSNVKRMLCLGFFGGGQS